MSEFTPIASLLGGLMIGASAVLLMASNGRIAGISGILSRLLPPYGDGADELIVRTYAQALERAVRRDPASFLWLQKKWKYPRPAGPAPTAADGVAAK